MSAGKVIGVVLAAAGGAALGVLFAPDKGAETRRKIAYKRDEYMDKMGNSFEEFKEGVSEELKSIKTHLAKKTEEAADKVDQITDQYPPASESTEFSPTGPFKEI